MISVTEITNKKQLRIFVDFPNRLYRGNPYFIPAIYSDDLDDWNPKKNPAFEYCEAKCFLAYKDGKVVGRVAAILNKAANEKWGAATLRFSQADFIDDYSVSEALFNAVEEYGREKGCTEIVGPMGFCDLDREGSLVEGFDRRSMFITYYNNPYYIEHFTRLGYGKNVDWVEFLLNVPQEGSELSERMRRISDIAAKRNNFRIADVRSAAGFYKYMQPLFELLNVAYAHLYGVVPLTDKQIVRYTKKYISIVDPRFTCVALNAKDEVVGFGISAPSIANALKKSNGRLFPLGALRILRALRKNDTLDLFLVAVKPELKGTGLNVMIVNHVLQSAQKMGIKYAETGPQLETNLQIQSQWKLFDLEHHKTRRCYIKRIETD